LRFTEADMKQKNYCDLIFVSVLVIAQIHWKTISSACGVLPLNYHQVNRVQTILSELKQSSRT